MRPEAALMVQHTLIPPMLIIQKQQTRLTVLPLSLSLMNQFSQLIGPKNLYVTPVTQDSLLFFSPNVLYRKRR